MKNIGKGQDRKRMETFALLSIMYKSKRKKSYIIDKKHIKFAFWVDFSLYRDIMNLK